VRFSRHAKNGARSIGATIADAERLIANPDEIDVETDGKRQYIGSSGDSAFAWSSHLTTRS
jgi:hypothetical protein